MKHRSAWTALAVLIICAVTSIATHSRTSQPPTPADYELLLTEARERKKNGDFRGGIELLENLSLNYPGTPADAGSRRMRGEWLLENPQREEEALADNIRLVATKFLR